MLTFTSAVGKPNLRLLWQHHTLLQVISQCNEPGRSIPYCALLVRNVDWERSKGAVIWRMIVVNVFVATCCHLANIL